VKGKGNNQTRERLGELRLSIVGASGICLAVRTDNGRHGATSDSGGDFGTN
jgi:hypothetical protein